MGKSAKLHKRVKKVKSGPGSGAPAAPAPQAQAQAAKKRATLKEKTAKSGSGSSKGGVLGGADYVDLMMGGRKKARQEAQKLPSS